MVFCSHEGWRRIGGQNGTVAHVKRETPESAFELVSSFFRKADLRFCNLEGPLGDLSKKEKIFSGR